MKFFGKYSLSKQSFIKTVILFFFNAKFNILLEDSNIAFSYVDSPWQTDLYQSKTPVYRRLRLLSSWRQPLCVSFPLCRHWIGSYMAAIYSHVVYGFFFFFCRYTYVLTSIFIETKISMFIVIGSSDIFIDLLNIVSISDIDILNWTFLSMPCERRSSRDRYDVSVMYHTWLNRRRSRLILLCTSCVL